MLTWTKDLHVCQSPHVMTEGTCYGQRRYGYAKVQHNAQLQTDTLPSFNLSTEPTFDSQSWFLSFSSVRCHNGILKRMNKPMTLPILQKIIMEFWTWVRDYGRWWRRQSRTRLMKSSERVTKMRWVWSVCQCTGSILTTRLLLTCDCINHADMNDRR